MARNTRKFRYLLFEIYPDNPAQMAAFDWLRSEDCTLLTGGMYILHEGEKNEDGTEKKPHYHVMIYRDVPLTGVFTQFGGQEWFQVDTVCNWLGTTDLFIDDSGVVHYKEFGGGDGLPDSVEWETKKIVGHCEGVTDAVNCAAYFLHSRFCDRHKKRYYFDDLKFWGEDTRFRQLFDSEDSLRTDLSFEVYTIAKNNDICRGEGQRLIQLCVEMSRIDLLNYIRQNHAFVEFYLLNPRRG